MCYNSRMKEARAEHKPYPTDLTDAQWSEIEPLYSGMRNRKWSKRELTNAVLYIVKTGCQWRQLPHDFPPYQTVYSFFSRGAKSGLWEEILAHLVEKIRKDAGKSAEPHYALRIPLIIAPKPAVSSSATQSFEKKRNSIALFAREINLVTQPSFDCEQGINSQVQTVCSNADAVFPVLGIVFCKNERFSLSRKTHVPLWNEPRISHVRLL